MGKRALCGGGSFVVSAVFGRGIDEQAVACNMLFDSMMHGMVAASMVVMGRHLCLK